MKSYFLSTMILFSLFFREFNVFSIKNFKIISNLGPLQRMSRITKHVSKAGKVDPSDRVTIPVNVKLNYTKITLCGQNSVVMI